MNLDTLNAPGRHLPERHNCPEQLLAPRLLPERNISPQAQALHAPPVQGCTETMTNPRLGNTNWQAMRRVRLPVHEACLQVEAHPVPERLDLVMARIAVMLA